MYVSESLNDCSIAPRFVENCHSVDFVDNRLLDPAYFFHTVLSV